METPTTTNARDTALASVPVEKRETLLRKASDLGVHGSDDVVWALVASVVDATAAAQAAGDAARETGAAVATIRNEVYQGAAKAAADVKATMETAIAATVNTSVATAAQAGADALRKAASDLPTVARQEQDRIVQEWRSALATAARSHAFAGFFQRLSGSVMLAVMLVGAIFIGGLISGGAGMQYVMTAQHRLTPPQWHLLVNQKGVPECGPFAGHMVCLAHKTPPRRNTQ